MNKSLVCLVSLGAVILAGCGTKPVVQTDPTDASRQTLGIDQSDVNATAQRMVESMLTAPAVVRVTGTTPPTIGIVPIRLDTNTITDTRINTDALTTLVRGQVINSGAFQFVDTSRRTDIAAEQAYQQDSGMVRQDTAARRGQQQAVTYILEGTISGFDSNTGKTRQKGYVITMTLQNVETGIILWQETQQVSKIQEKRTFGF